MTSNTDMFRGYVDYYNEEKGYGFAIVRIGRVFFHKDAGRAVEGTPEAPVLTSRPNDKPVRWFRRCNNPSKLIMKVGRGTKGPKAVVWGVIPERTELEELKFRGALAQYVGGSVRILRMGQHGTSVLRGLLLAEPQLQTGDPEQLHLAVDDRTHGKSAGRKELSFALEWLTSRAQRYGGRTLQFYEGNDTVEIHLALPEA